MQGGLPLSWYVFRAIIPPFILIFERTHYFSNLGEQAEARGGCYHYRATQEGRTCQRPYLTNVHLLIPRR